jgi:hypothetical protein
MCWPFSLPMSLTANVSSEYFAKSQALRNGAELFNVTGDKVRVLKDFIDKNAKKIKDRDEAKYAPPYQVRRVNELLELRKIAMVRKRIENMPLTSATKAAICGDELSLREYLDRGYPINFRDGAVTMSLSQLTSLSYSYVDWSRVAS